VGFPQIFIEVPIVKFMDIRPQGEALVHADRRTRRS